MTLEQLAKEILELERQRDELAEALRECVQTLIEEASDPYVIDRARAALAKLESSV